MDTIGGSDSTGTAEEGVNEVLGEGWGDDGVPCKTDDRDGSGDDVLNK